MKLLLEPGHMSFEITKRETTIGRSESCDWCVPSEKFSRTHCVIYQLDDNQGYAIMDPGSKNGVIVDGVKILKEKMVKISHHSHIQLANTYYLHLEMPISELKLQKHNAPDLIDKSSEEDQIRAAREHRAKNPTTSKWEPTAKKKIDYAGGFKRLALMSLALIGVALTYIYYIYFKF